MDTVLFILIGLVGLSIVVTVHEAGHFLAARWAGVEVEAFALGWGKVLWKWKPGTTEYRLCLLPLGGYCKMKGERDLIAALEHQDGVFEPSSGSLFAAPPWKRIVISAAGPLANLVFAFAAFLLILGVGVPQTAPEARILLSSEIDGRTGLPADLAGLKTGDLVLEVDGQGVRTFLDLQQKIAAASGKAQIWAVDRQGTRLSLTVKPRYDEAVKRSLVGVFPLIDPVVKDVRPQSAAALAGFQPGDRITSAGGKPVRSTQAFLQALQGSRSLEVGVDRRGSPAELLVVSDDQTAKGGVGLTFVLPSFPARGLGPVQALAEAWKKTWDLFGQMVHGLVQLFTGKVSASDSLSGPLRITYMAGEVTSQGFGDGWGQGWGTAVNLLAFISLALFLMNLLPIPALDGGSIVVSLVEAVRHKPLGIKALIRYQQVGMVFILGLILFATFNDLGFLFGPK